MEGAAHLASVLVVVVVVVLVVVVVVVVVPPCVLIGDVMADLSISAGADGKATADVLATADGGVVAPVSPSSEDIAMYLNSER